MWQLLMSQERPTHLSFCLSLSLFPPPLCLSLLLSLSLFVDCSYTILAVFLTSSPTNKTSIKLLQNLSPCFLGWSWCVWMLQISHFSFPCLRHRLQKLEKKRKDVREKQADNSVLQGNEVLFMCGSHLMHSDTHAHTLTHCPLQSACRAWLAPDPDPTRPWWLHFEIRDWMKTFVVWITFPLSFSSGWKRLKVSRLCSSMPSDFWLVCTRICFAVWDAEPWI